MSQRLKVSARQQDTLMPPSPRTRSKLLRKALLAILAFPALVFVAVNLLAIPKPPTLAAPARAAVTVIADVNLVDLKAGSIVPDQMIVITGNEISFVGPAGSHPVPEDAQVVGAAGKFLIPGLWDSHVHTLRLSPQLHFPLLIANGVTSARDMGDACSWSESTACRPDAPRWRAQLERGDLVGPRLIETVSFHLESLPEDDGELAALIDALQARGDPFLKIQLDDQVRPDEFAKVMRAVSAQGYTASGHIPFSIDLAGATYPIGSIEHDWSLLPQCSDTGTQFDGKSRSKAALLKAMSHERCRRVLSHLATHAIAYVPTHVASTGQDRAFGSAQPSTSAQVLRDKYVIAPLRWIWSLVRAAGKVEAEEQALLAQVNDAALALTKQAHEAGVNLLVGTDALDADVVHGFSLHTELEQLVAAGLTPAQALLAATAAPARQFGMEARLGTIARGSWADLVVLDADPLTDIRNTRQIHAVIADGRVYGASERTAALQFVEEQAHRISVICRFLRGIWFDG